MTRPSLMLRLAPGLIASALLTVGLISIVQSVAASTPKVNDMLVFYCQEEDNEDLEKVEAEYKMNPAESIKDLAYIFDRSTGTGYEWNNTEKALVRWRPFADDNTVAVYASSFSRDGKTIVIKGIEYDYSSGDMMIDAELTEIISLESNTHTFIVNNSGLPGKTSQCVRLLFPKGIKFKPE